MDAIQYSELHEARGGKSAPLAVDVRRRPAFLGAKEISDGAIRRDPGEVASWASRLPRAAHVVVYRVHGHDVSQNTATALNDLGVGATSLQGGIDEGWTAKGGALFEKPADAYSHWHSGTPADRLNCVSLVNCTAARNLARTFAAISC